MDKVNFLFLLSDDQGAWALGCGGNPDIKTPHLDQLAQEGVLFENFFCASPVCSPARASILTGEMPSCHGVQDWLCGGNMDTEKYPDMKALHAEHFTSVDHAIEYLQGHPSYVAELARHGYRCGHSGKWHLGNHAAAKEGFEKWSALAAGGCGYYKGDRVEEGQFTLETEYITDLITEKAMDYLEEFAQTPEPFYVSVHYTAPHSPWNKENHPKEYLDWYENSDFASTPQTPIHPEQIGSCPIGDTPEKWRANYTGYYAAISAMDANIGRLLQKLEDLGQRDNTIVIFTSDNGMNLGQHGIWGKGNGTYPPNMYDTSVKVPCIISGNLAQEQKGTVCSALSSHCDLFPTILDCAGIAWEGLPSQSGESFLPLLLGQPQTSKKEVGICDEYGFVRMLRNEQYKLVINYFDQEKNQFFSLVDDPMEEENLYGQEKYRDIVENMTLALEEFFQKYSSEEHDGKFHPVTGKGQQNLSYLPDAFLPKMKFYWEGK